MTDHLFSPFLHLDHVSYATENGFYGKKSHCMSCPNTKSIDIFSLGTYLDHSGAIFGYMMDFQTINWIQNGRSLTFTGSTPEPCVPDY